MLVGGQHLGEASHDAGRRFASMVPEIADHVEQLPVAVGEGIGARLGLAQGTAHRRLRRTQGRGGQRRHDIAFRGLRERGQQCLRRFRRLLAGTGRAPCIAIRPVTHLCD